MNIIRTVTPTQKVLYDLGEVIFAHNIQQDIRIIIIKAT